MTSNYTDKPAGLFITHVLNDRVAAHFERLRAESEQFVDWQLVLNQGTVDESAANASMRSVSGESRLMHAHRKGLPMGYLDVLIVPLAIQAQRPFVWGLEYDVDFSGTWSDFFAQFAENEADLLTTTVNTPDRDPDWSWWSSAINPPDAAHLRVRSFNPVFRVSRPFLTAYGEALSEGAWDGHYEFLFPTIARARGLTVEDIGGDGPFTPAAIQGQNYRNSPNHPHLTPGTFVWRPSSSNYFHERPDEFTSSNMLHHPVKPDVREWETTEANMLAAPRAVPFLARLGRLFTSLR